MIDLSIIIVSWNVADLLAACLISILNSSDTLNKEIIVVDSASTDHSLEMLNQHFKDDITLLTQQQNIGFVRGNNLALKQARGRYILLLNPDTEIIGNALAQMVHWLDENPAVGIVGPHTLNTDGSTQSTRRRLPTRLTAFFESTWLQPYAPSAIINHYTLADQPDDATLAVDWVQGSALMLRRTVYEQIGSLDEGFVMYSEELDWCHRARNAGWQVTYLGTAKIIHHGGKSSDQIVAKRHIMFQQSKIRYFHKYHGALFASLLRLFLLISYAWQMLLEAIKGVLGHKRALRQERVKQYWQVLRSGLKG